MGGRSVLGEYGLRGKGKGDLYGDEGVIYGCALPRVLHTSDPCALCVIYS